MAGTGAADTRGVGPVVWGSVPLRNRNFTGREDLLEDLRRRLTGVTAVLPHALHGMGGVGKTQLAIEYAYRFADDYEVIWWVPADQSALVRSSLAALAPRLGLTGIAPERVEDGVRAVLDSLRRGEPFAKWLLIFDNADQPEQIKEWLPNGPGDVLVTSRNRRWQAIVNAIEVDVFTRTESLEFLRRRVPGSVDADSDRLAEALGDLPLALEQAGALQFETGMSVPEYLDLLNTEARKLLAENPPSDYTLPVAAAWGLSVARLEEQMPFALELLRRCAFFGPEPIRRDLLQRGRHVLPDTALRASLGDPIILSRAMRELGRYALARIDNNRRTIQVHRLIQKLLRDELPIEEARKIRHEVHLLLAAADPASPEDPATGPLYHDLLAHVEPSELTECRDVESRRLVKNILDYLYYVGDYTTCRAEINRALENRQKIGEDSDHRDALVLLGQLARVLWAMGHYREAAKTRLRILDRAPLVLGRDDEYTLHTISGRGADLRSEGAFSDALRSDEELLERTRRILGAEHPDTYKTAHNLAIDYCLVGKYSRAREIDEQNYQDRRDLYGSDDDPWVLTSLGAIGRDMRLAGQYAAAARRARQAQQMFDDITARGVLPPNHPWRLLQAKDYSVALRKVGSYSEALALAEQVYQDHQEVLGRDHPETLGAAINLGNAQRLAGDFTDAVERIEKTVDRLGSAWGEEHPFTYGCTLNMAIVERLRGDLDAADSLLQKAVEGLRRTVGPGHHYTLTCITNLATTTAELGNVGAAREMEEEAFRELRVVLGESHPHTLACAANLALDRRELGLTDEAAILAEETRQRYVDTLGEDHPDVRDAIRGERLTLDFEPPEV